MQHNRAGEQKSYRLLGLFSLLFLLVCPSFLWGSFEDFKRQQNRSFAEYKDARDAAFNNYLRAQWQEYTAKEALSLYENPKPKSITPTVSKKIQSVGPLVHIKLQEPQKEQEEVVEFKPNKIKKTDIAFDFFGKQLAFDVEQSLRRAKFYPYTQNGIANFFGSVASGEYGSLVEAIEAECKALELNDWGVYQLVSKLSNNIFEVQDEARLMSWFLLNKLGYNVKVGLWGKSVVLMHYSKKVIYATPSFVLEKKKYYLLSEYAKTSHKRVYTYKQEYPGANKALDLSLRKIPKFPNDKREKHIAFTQHSQKYTVTFNYNQNLIDFLASYPQADYETYFNAPMQEETYADIAAQIKEYVDAKEASIAINFVLNFVQSAFKYERDNEQFQREKVMFAQETLVYDKSDCEDRATLFAYLVKKLFHISVLGVKYKDHMATALYIPMRGDSVVSGRKRYVIADPTYLNANIGQSMPKYKSKIPQSFIVVQSDGE